MKTKILLRAVGVLLGIIAFVAFWAGHYYLRFEEYQWMIFPYIVTLFWVMFASAALFIYTSEH